MGMERALDDGLDELFAGTEAPAVESAATAVAAPEADTPPITELDATSEPETPSPEPAQSEEPPVAQPPVQPNWNSPENPHFQAAQQLAALRHAAEQARWQQQQEATRKSVGELIDGDPDRAQVFGQVIQQTVAPLQQQLQSQEGALKASAAFLIAAKAHLTEDQLNAVLGEMDDLMAVEGADHMEKRAFAKRDAQQSMRTQLSAKDARIAELERAVAAKAELAERETSGADRVDGGSGVAGLSRRERLEHATGDDFFDILFEPQARTG